MLTCNKNLNILNFRQQERHLGIIKSLDAPTTRKKHEVHSFIINKDNNLNQSPNSNTPLRYLDIQSSVVSFTPMESIAATIIPNVTSLRTAKLYAANTAINNDTNLQIRPTYRSEVESWILATPTVVVEKREIIDKALNNSESKEELIDLPLEEDASNETLLFKREIIKPEQQPPVQVYIQNITEVSIKTRYKFKIHEQRLLL